jgi:hypothetical protein
MNPTRPTNRKYLALLVLLAGVLVLGIVQWSFLPILIQNGPVGNSAVLEMSAGHSSKFAAPFKCLFGDGLKPSVAQSRISVPAVSSRMPEPADVPTFCKDEFFLSNYPLRAPPSA